MNNRIEKKMQLIALYIVSSLLIGVLGRNRKMGFWGYFFGSLALSPPIGLILVCCSDKQTPTHSS